MQKKTYPRYYQSSSGREQIKLESPTFQVYLRAVKYTDAQDYNFSSGPVKKHHVETITCRFEPSTEENFQQLQLEVTRYFAELAGLQLVAEKSNTRKLALN